MKYVGWRVGVRDKPISPRKPQARRPRWGLLIHLYLLAITFLPSPTLLSSHTSTLPIRPFGLGGFFSTCDISILDHVMF